MAVVDLTTYKKSSAGIPVDSVSVGGADVLHVLASFPITDTESIASIYRIAEIPSNFIPIGGEITCDGITSVNDADLGLYETDEQGGAVIDVDALMDGGDISSALPPGGGLSPISAVTIANQDAALYTLAGDVSSERQAYVLALTINAAATATGTVIVRLTLVRREYVSAT